MANPGDISQPNWLNDKTLALLACRACCAALIRTANGIRCGTCSAALEFRDEVAIAREMSSHSYFDDVYEIMRIGNHARGTREIFYEQQSKAVERTLSDGEVVVDIGCGPELPYRKNGSFVIGVDPSFHSIRANQAVDLRIFASAADMPLADASADAVICFYSVHHMTAETVEGGRVIVENAFREVARVLKPTGRLMIFDMSPWLPFGALQNVIWNAARRRLGRSLDMFFWKAESLRRVGEKFFPGASLSITRFSESPFQTFPPIFSKPGLRVPRFLYPFHINLYQWQNHRAGS